MYTYTRFVVKHKPEKVIDCEQIQDWQWPSPQGHSALKIDSSVLLGPSHVWMPPR